MNKIGETFSCTHSRALLKPHIHTWSRSSLEGNNTERKTGSRVCFPSFKPPTPTSPSLLYAFSPLTRIVLSAEVKALDILMLLFKQATTLPRAHFRDTMKYIFLLFLVTAARWFVAAVLEPLTGNLGRLFFFLLSPFFPDHDLGPDAKSTTESSTNPPPLPLDPSLQSRQAPSFFCRGVGGTRHRKAS